MSKTVYDKGGCVDLENVREQGVQSNKSKVVWRNVFLIAFILSAIVSVVFFAIYKYRQSDDYAKYTEKGCASYQVALKEDYNPYGNGVASSNMQYLSSKLEGLDANLYYKLNMKEGEVEYKYTYTLKEVVQVASKETGKTIISYENKIKTKTVNSVKADELMIGETHYLDYSYHDAQITEFINQQSDLRTHSVICTLKLVLEINLKGVCQDFEDDFSKHPTVYISVPLTTDTVSITSGSNITKGEGKIILCKNLGNDKPYLITTYACAGSAVLLFVLWYVYGKLTMSQDDKFVKTTNKIQSNYGSYIQQISQPISQNYEQVIEFSKFVDLLEVSNIIKQPVFIEKKTDDETVYVVPESSTRIYMFRLNKDVFIKKNKAEKPEKVKKQQNIQHKVKQQAKIEKQVEHKQLDEVSKEQPKQEKIEEQPKLEKKEKAEHSKKEKSAMVKKEQPVKEKLKKAEKISKPIKVEEPIKIAKPEKVKKTVKSAKINRARKTTISKRQARKEQIFKIIDSDLQKLAAKRDNSSAEKASEYKSSDDKPAQNKTAKTKTFTTNVNTKKSEPVKKSTSKKLVKKSASKSSAIKVKQSSKSPTAVNLSFGGVDDGKVINVSIQTTDD